MKSVKINKEKATKLFANPSTKQLFNWVANTLRITNSISSPAFFHSSHTEEQRVMICFYLENFFSDTTPIKIERTSKDGVMITKLKPCLETQKEKNVLIAL
jgi:hypothetical protein